MFHETDPGMFWLNVTNFALGAVVVIACAIVIGSVFQEVFARLRHHVDVKVPLDDHSFVLPELGLTMADGGKRDEKSTERSNDTPRPKR